MTVKLVVPPQEVFYDANGTPLDGGFIYIGQADQNPETHPLAIYWDTGLTQAAAQPVRTVNGYPSNNGRAGTLYVAADYSMTIRNWAGQLVSTLTTSAGLAGGGGSTSNQQKYPFAGDGSTVSFILPTGAGFAAIAVNVLVSGISQASDTYTLVGNTLTFSEAPPSPPSGVTNNIEVQVTETIAVPIGTTGAAYVTYTPEGIGAVDRTVQDRLRDQATAQDFGTLQQAVDTARTIHFGPGTYAGTVTLPASMSLEADATADLTGLTFTGSLRKGNRFTFGGDYESTQGYLGHPAPNKGNSWQNALAVVRGTDASPDTTALYARTAAFIEMHSAVDMLTEQANWSNPWLLPALTVEHRVHPGSTSSPTAGAFRVVQTHPATSADPSRENLVGVAAVASSNVGAGEDAPDVWGANIIASQISGNKPDNCVGIEVDVSHSSDHVVGGGGAPGPTTGNFTGYWAQSAGKAGVYSSAAFFASRTVESGGWNWVLYGAVPAKQWSIYIDNPETTGTAGGLFLRSSASGGKVMRVQYDTGSGNINQFEITPDASDAIWMKVGGSLKQVTEGAADSAGAGFRQLRVAN